MYREGIDAGEATLYDLLDRLIDDPVSATRGLNGTFFVAALNEESGQRYIFTDPNGLFQACCSKYEASDSLLELAVGRGLSAADLDPRAVAELVQMGQVGFLRTLFRGIRKISPEEVLTFGDDGAVISLPRPIPRVSECGIGRTLPAYFSALAQCIRRETISSDLTGGSDSRLLNTQLAFTGLPFEMLVAGSEESEEVRIARRVSSLLDRPLEAVCANPDGLTTMLPHLFLLTDGMADVLSYYQPVSMYYARARRGNSLVLTGAGGEIFKEFWWLQSFPFYRLSGNDLTRFFDYRVAPGGFRPQLFAGSYSESCSRLRQDLLKEFQQFEAPLNTQAYDNAVYYFRMRYFGGRMLTAFNRIINTHAPFLAHDCYGIGYHLPRRVRFFNYYHRKLVTAYSPDIAAIATTQGGTSCSTSFSRLVVDAFLSARYRFVRLRKKLEVRLLHRPRDRGELEWITAAGRALLCQRRTIPRLQNLGILDPAIMPEQIPGSYVGNLLTLDLVLDWIADNHPTDAFAKLCLSPLARS